MLLGFVVNISLISQTSVAVTIGPVLLPLLIAAEISPITAGGALLLGSSIGGEMLNPGAPEYTTVLTETNRLVHPAVAAHTLLAVALPLVLLQLAVATSLFWWISLRREARLRLTTTVPETVSDQTVSDSTEEPRPIKASALKAAVPLVPLALLFLTSPPLRWIHVPFEWLTDPKTRDLYDSRLIGAAMLVGVVTAILV